MDIEAISYTEEIRVVTFYVPPDILRLVEPPPADEETPLAVGWNDLDALASHIDDADLEMLPGDVGEFFHELVNSEAGYFEEYDQIKFQIVVWE